MGDNVPYPTVRSRQDLRENRAQTIRHWQEGRVQSNKNSASVPGGQ
jgi:hypothetical protein